MEINQLINETVGKMNPTVFGMLKEKLVGEYITFSIIDSNNVTTDIFMEKLCDYFEKVSLKSSDDFDQLIKKYLSDWTDLVEDNIAEESSEDKKENAKPIVPRTRKYFLHAKQLSESRSITAKQLTDYSRILFCLYTAIINNGFKPTDDFDLSIKCLDIDKIINAMRQKKQGGFLFIGGGSKFDTSDAHGEDTGVFVLTIIMYYHIKNNEVIGEY